MFGVLLEFICFTESSVEAAMTLSDELSTWGISPTLVWQPPLIYLQTTTVPDKSTIIRSKCLSK